jgi:AbrB family looped-hinge helix DNA binding protein
MYLTLGDIMQIALTKMSSKGQIVIPSELRENMKEGEQLLIIKNDHQLILKKTSELDKNLKEDLEFARRTEEAWKEYDKGKFKKTSFDEFLAEAEKW